MQDRFKFRFWDKETQTMQKCPMVELRHRITLDEIFADDRVIFMQSTGLKDKNGTLIYEGDIVNYSCLPGYSDIYACTFNNGSFLIGGLLISNTHLKSAVIGNIYESPELLEV